MREPGIGRRGKALHHRPAIRGMHLDATRFQRSTVGDSGRGCVLELVQRIPGPYRERYERL